MGITFRSGNYIKFVFFGGRTIKEGEAAAIWDVNGKHKQIIGPKRKWMYKSTIRFLNRHKAESHQYIRVAYRDGTVRHIYGPSEIYENPVLHDSVKVYDGIKLECSTDCIIVYEKSSQQDMNGDTESFGYKVAPTAMPVKPDVVQATSNEKNKIHHAYETKTQKRKIYGPDFFLPKENESVHKFHWSGSDSSTTDNYISKDKNIFQVLHTDPNRVWSVNLPIITSDSANFSARLFIKYYMNSIEKCILSEDPIDKMYKGLKADAHLFGNTISSDQLRQEGQNHNEVTKGLVNMETYTSLKEAATACGFSIESVKVESLCCSPELQAQALSDQKLSAALRTEMAEKTQRRQLHELDVEDRRKRIDQDAELKRIQMETDARLEEEIYSLKQAELERRVALRKREVGAEQEIEDIANKNIIMFLKALSEENVDMTKFLCTAGGMDVVSPVLARAPVLNTQTTKKKACWKSDD